MKRYWTYVLIVFALVVFVLIDFGAAYSDDTRKSVTKLASQVNRQAQQTRQLRPIIREGIEPGPYSPVF
jgi:Flp pilus assembly protein TadG